jgi:hypothetical protein
MYGIMRCEKRKMSAVGGLEAEANREHKIDLPASDIDWDKTRNNVYMVRSTDWRETICRTLQEHGISRWRKDAVVMIDSLYTASPEFFQQSVDQSQIIDYFRDCLDFHNRHYGHVINAVIHLDETTPHLAVASVPIVQRDGKYTLSAKELMGNRSDYRARQDAFWEEVSSQYGLERGEPSDPLERREHLSVQEYKIDRNNEDIAYLEGRKIALQEDVNSLDRGIDALETKIDQLQEIVIDKHVEIGKIDRVRDLVSGIADVIRDQMCDVDTNRSADLDVLEQTLDRCDQVVDLIDAWDDDPVD